jgi:arylsulfatase A
MVQSDTALYDMRTDPGQKTDISGDHSSLTLAMAGAYNRWFEEVMSEYHPQSAIMVGFNKEIEAYLPAHESVFSGVIHFKEGHGWAHDWLVNWTRTLDSIYWDIEVVETIDFDIFIRYSCPESDSGSKIIVRSLNDRSEQVLSKPWDPGYIPSPDRVKRVEVYEKEWERQKLGTLHFEKGRQYVSLKADAIAGKQVCEVKGIYLEKTNKN